MSLPNSAVQPGKAALVETGFGYPVFGDEGTVADSKSKSWNWARALNSSIASATVSNLKLIFIEFISLQMGLLRLECEGVMYRSELAKGSSTRSRPVFCQEPSSRSKRLD